MTLIKYICNVVAVVATISAIVCYAMAGGDSLEASLSMTVAVAAVFIRGMLTITKAQVD